MTPEWSEEKERGRDSEREKSKRTRRREIDLRANVRRNAYAAVDIDR